MFLKAIFISPILLLAACSSPFMQHNDYEHPLVHYARNSSKIITINTVASTGNPCVDNFNFLRSAGDDRYPNFSDQYITIGNGYSFLNTNKKIMDKDARQVYTMKLDMKLDTLCSKVNYAGYQLVQKKMKELKNI
ncbi:hypothetical protein [Kosakonia cowanii]|uniref:hypothetical protein n=1 Tax=Kosakonia cowanii TaxID=208223 RepID=UPI0012FD13EB|nr:hypothetical protein [Kosakonia cowanii]